MRRSLPALVCLSLACGEGSTGVDESADGGESAAEADAEGDDGTSGDGDGSAGDGSAGDGTSGDGDGTSGDGDGTSGDGTSGDGTSGDGDGTSGDGDGTSGDGDGGSGDGDGTSGDGDGSSGDGDGSSGDGDGDGDGDGTVCWGSSGDAIWPGPWTTVAVDDDGIGLGNNLSGVVWDWSDDSIWVVMNGPSYLRRLQWVPLAQEWQIHPSWPTNGLMQYPGGGGQPDTEGITIDGQGQLLVSTERDNDVGGTSRLSVLRYDPSTGPGVLPASIEWDLTATFAAESVVVAPNGGLEAITFLPDAAMTALGLWDETNAAPYDPAALAPHLGGLVAVGVEETGEVFVFTLFDDGTHALVARVATGLARIMSLEYDRETDVVWAGCDNSCANAMSVLEVDTAPGATQGRFVVTRSVDRPAGLDDDNNEGFALGPSGVSFYRKVLWTRDGGGNGTSIWQGDLDEGPPCD